MYLKDSFIVTAGYSRACCVCSGSMVYWEPVVYLQNLECVFRPWSFMFTDCVPGLQLRGGAISNPSDTLALSTRMKDLGARKQARATFSQNLQLICM